MRIFTCSVIRLSTARTAIRYLVIAALLAFFALPPLHSQGVFDSLRTRYGVSGYFVLNNHDADFQRIPSTLSCCSTFTGGVASGFGLGVLTEFPLDESFLIALHASYLTQPFEMTTREGTRIIVDGVGTDGAFDHHLNGKFTTVGVEPLIVYRPLTSLFINAGLRLGFIGKTSYTQWEQLSEPARVGTFLNPDGTDSHLRTRNTYTGALPNTTAQFAAVLGVSYELPMNRKKTFLLAPEIAYHFALNNVVSGLQWKANVLLVGLSLKYSPGALKALLHEHRDEFDTMKVHVVADVNKTEVVEGISRTSIDTNETDDEIIITEHLIRTDTLVVYTKPNVISASIRAYSVDSSGAELPKAQLRVEEFLSTEMMPLLPYVFFDHNSSAIPSRYQTSDKSRDVSLLENVDARQDRITTYYQVLNIVGHRMTKNPNAVLTLTGCTDNNDEEEKNLTLAKSRAEELKNYLMTQWKIPSDRIRTEGRILPAIASNSQTADGAAENRRVEFSSNDFAIISPVLSRDTLRISNPPSLSFATQASATAGLKSWTVEVQQHSRTLKTWSGKGTPDKVLGWQLNTEPASAPSLNEKLDATLTVHDSVGQQRSATASTGVELVTIRKKKLERRGDKEIARFSVNLFAIRHSEVSALDKQVLGIVKQNIQPSSAVSIYGFTDRTGDPTYNRNLALSRAKSVAAELSSFNIVRTELKSDALPYNNDLPEGRFYSRTVEVEAETPVQY